MSEQEKYEDFRVDRAKLTALHEERGKTNNLYTWVARLAGFSDDGAGSGILTGRMRLSERRIELIEKALDLPRSAFEARVRKAAHSLQELDGLYDTLAEGHVVSIVSADGFKEASERSLLRRMVELVNSGVEVRYYFPENAERSIEDYLLLQRQFTRSLPRSKRANVSAHQFAPSALRLFGWMTRFVVFSQWKEEGTQETEHVFLYTRAGAVALGSDSHPSGTEIPSEVWIRLEKANGREYYQELVARSIPFVRERLEDRLASRLQNEYRFSFSQAKDSRTYSKLREFVCSAEIATDAVQQLASRSWGKMLRDSRHPEIRVLDIGPGDGLVTEAVMDRLNSLFGQLRFDLTTVEPPSRSRPDQSKWLDSSICRRIGEPFEDFDPGRLKFDLILAVHSFYLVDPSYLLKLVELLRPDGAAIVVMAPLEDNFLSQVTLAIDQHLMAQDPATYRRDPYQHKVVEIDPLRNYAEDVEPALDRYLAGSFERKDFETSVPTSELFDDDGKATGLARDIVELFGHGLLVEIDELIDRCWEIAEKLGVDDALPCFNRRYLLLRNNVGRALQKRANGTIV